MKNGHQAPVNRTAANVVARGESFEYRQLPTEICSATPLPLKDVPADSTDLTGIKFGRLTVLGFSADLNGRWACKCLCGNYVMRRALTIKKAPADSACAQCYLMAVSKRAELLRRTGKERHTREFM